MSKGVKRVLGAVAAVAIPFAAPAIAGALGASSALAGTATGAFLGTAGGSALTGAVLGGASSALTGGDPLAGALMGGIGGFAGGGGLRNMFGGAVPAGQQAVGGGLFGGPGMTAGTPLYQQGFSGAGLLPPGATTATTGAGGLSGFFQNVSQGFLANPAGMAQLAMTVFGRAPQELTDIEKQRLEELKALAATDRELFEQRVQEARGLLQKARQEAPKPEQAYGAEKIAAERQLAEATRGLDPEAALREKRKAKIRAAQVGATAAAAEETRGRGEQTRLTQAGLNVLPTAAPEGYAGLALPTYEALQERRNQYRSDLARATGDLFGGI